MLIHLMYNCKEFCSRGKVEDIAMCEVRSLTLQEPCGDRTDKEVL